jgi:hypothetical protein
MKTVIQTKGVDSVERLLLFVADTCSVFDVRVVHVVAVVDVARSWVV